LDNSVVLSLFISLVDGYSFSVSLDLDKLEESRDEVEQSLCEKNHNSFYDIAI